MSGKGGINKMDETDKQVSFKNMHWLETRRKYDVSMNLGKRALLFVS